jgi:S1-C subfamily serine protease
MRYGQLATALAAVGGLGLPAHAPPAQGQADIPAIVRHTADAVVTLTVYDADGRKMTLGSGFFLPDGRIVTNLHVVRGGSRVEVLGASGQLLGTIPFAEVVSEEADLAVLPRLARTPRRLALAGARPRVGETVVVIGAPEGLSNTVSNGIVSAFRDIEGRPRMQISAPISPGSSGGPVLNGRGQVVGVSLSILQQGQNLNFAVPLDDVRAMLASPAGRIPFPGGPESRVAKAALPPREGATTAGLAPMLPLSAGRAARGALEPGDPRMEDGSLYDLYFFAAQAGQRVTVEMRSGAVDAYLSWGRMNGGKFEPLGSDDNGAGGTDARLAVTIPADGVYTVRANARRAGQTGAYALTLAAPDGDPKPAPEVKPGS